MLAPIFRAPLEQDETDVDQNASSSELLGLPLAQAEARKVSALHERSRYLLGKVTMALAIVLFCYFAPPILSLFVGETFVMFGRAWLFNVCWVFFWPVLIWFLPTSRH